MKERLKTMFTRNIGMKLLSIVLAFFIWIIIMSISNPQITIVIEDIPVDRRNEEAVSKENMVYEALSGDKVTIRVKGTRSEIESLTADDFVAYVDFREIGWVNAVPIHVEPKNEELEKHMVISYQSDKVMSISLVEHQMELVMVEVQLENVPEEYYAYCSSVSSKLLEVSGSKTQVESVEKLIGKVDMSNRTEDFQTNVSLYAVDDKGNVIDDSKIRIAQRSVLAEIIMLPVKEVPVVIDTSGVTVAEGFGISRVEYSPKTVQIAAETSVLATVKELVIPYSAEKLIQSQEVELEIARYLPENVYLKSETDMVYLNLVVERLISKDFVVDCINVDVKNLDERFGVNFQNTMFTVSLYGVEGEITNLTSGELDLYIDMAACTGTGLFSVPVRTDNKSVKRLDTKIGVIVYGKY